MAKLYKVRVKFRHPEERHIDPKTGVEDTLARPVRSSSQRWRKKNASGRDRRHLTGKSRR